LRKRLQASFYRYHQVIIFGLEAGVLAKISKLISGVAAASVMCFTLLGPTAAAQEKKVKDRGEYDLYNAISVEKDGAKRLSLLDQWKQKYPDTDYKKERLLYYLNTYKDLSQPQKMIDMAKEILAIDPKDLTSLYYMTILEVSQNPTNPPEGVLSDAEKAAKGVLENAEVVFAADKKPKGASDSDWDKAKKDMQATAHRTLGWVAFNRKNYPEAEKEFKATIEANPQLGIGIGDVTYWLAQSISGQKDVARTPEALYYYARAASYAGPGALTPEGKKQIEDYLNRAYKAYHSSDEGLADVKTKAGASPTMPAGFTIVSGLDLEKDKLAKEEQFKKDHPELALWIVVKQELKGANGAAYWESSVKDSGLPKLKGKLVSQSPAVRPKELVLAISDDTTGEVTLKLSAPMAGKAPAGTELEFEGAVPKAYTTDPFMVTMEIEKEKITGWPEQPKAPPAAHRPVQKKKQ
jgi:tetratricopeptide (TPR) repeat protein